MGRMLPSDGIFSDKQKLRFQIQRKLNLIEGLLSKDQTLSKVDLENLNAGLSAFMDDNGIGGLLDSKLKKRSKK